jgi:ethylbenzene hydroxylase subunit gamma/complex iron-sulfur molybdoenzyme family reductase subunit gamma
MEARFVPTTDLETLLDPGAPGWSRARVERVALEGTPLQMQPSGQVQASWKERKIGAVDALRLAAVHDGRTLAFLFEWRSPTESSGVGENDQFPDAAAILLPSAPNAPLFMGAPGQAVNAWYWRADDNPAGRHVVPEGLGTSRTLDTELVQGRGVHEDGRWRVVIARALRVETSEPVAQLAPGEATGFCVAVWDGGSGERAGIKSFSGQMWRELRLAAAPTAGR